MPNPELLAELTLARGALDRAGERRSDVAWLEQGWSDPRSRVMVLHRGSAPVVDSKICFMATNIAPPGVRLLLGVDRNEVVYWAVLVDVERDEPPYLEGISDIEFMRWAALRDVGSALSDRDAGLMVSAVALSQWHWSHTNCPRCGAMTEVDKAGWARTCPVDASEHFPRNDPAVIVLVVDRDDRALLGRRADFPDSWFSTLAGFVEAGESAEMALVREMAEEAGVHLDPSDLDYLGSQPWPFPSSLMLGYLARYRGDPAQARPDGEEIDEVRWFTREELMAGCTSGEVKIPGPISIARRLIEHWYGSPLPGQWSRP